ncbi:zinc finger protein [Macleaya cordata]|uniref:Zinc finger protein n=1 Tax=Macleaya cordata TaxID=56857 RepID=A0A200Q981_MACCD|nr:zinc finger protein [Macleaya cordata]
MQRCSSSHCNPVGPCSCGLYHGSSSGGNSFSMLFSSMPNNHHHKPFNDQYFDAYPISSFTSSSSSSSSSSSAVDCTLSLGTPSTRHQTNNVVGGGDNKSSMITHHRKSTSCVSNICWDVFQTKQHHQNPNSSATHNKIINSRSDANSLIRRCANCDTTSTPLWRNGPRGPKSLCNACGIRYKKEERRATTTTTTNGINAVAAVVTTTTVVEPQQQELMMNSHQYHNSSWAAQHHSHNTQRTTNSTYPPPSLNIGNHEFRFIEDHHQRDSNSASSNIPFLSWRFNVATDRPSQLVHDYT